MPLRPASAVIDLTANRVDLNDLQGTSHSNTNSERRGVKRRRVQTPNPLFPSNASSSNEPRARRASTNEHIDSVDLTEVNDDSSLAKVLAKQREDAIKAQAASENREGRTTLTATKCAICMDTPTDATTTVCGHMFCHKCIIDSLRYEEERSQATSAKASRGKCPACRKLLTRKDGPGARRDLIPLQFKLKQPS